MNYNIGKIDIGNRRIGEASIRFERSSPDKLVLSKKDDVTYVFVIKEIDSECEKRIDEVILNEKDLNINDKKSNHGNLEINGSKNHYINAIKSNYNFEYETIKEIENEILNENKDYNYESNNSELYNYVSVRNINTQQLEQISSNVDVEQSLYGEFRTGAQQLTELDASQKEILFNLLWGNRRVFVEKQGPALGYEHHLRVLTSKPTVRKHYPVPFAFREEVRKAIEEMLRLGIIERSVSPFCNPMRITRKGDKSIRVCLDARETNKIIENDLESPPLISEILQNFGEIKYFSKMDLSHGYWQIPLHEDSRKLTAFLFNNTQYQYKRIPFGLKTAGAGFIRALKNALAEIAFLQEIAIYIDDMLIATKTFDEHIEILKKIFQRLIKFNFTLKFSKCVFFQKNITFLGFLLTPSGIIPDPDKLKYIRDFEEPKNKTDLQSFLGVCNYYRQFNVTHSRDIDPLRELLMNNAKWKWTDVHVEAFHILKIHFLNHISISYIIPNAIFKIQTDASDRGIGAILYQDNEKGDHCLIAIVSRCLSGPELNYTTCEKELLAVVYAVTKFRVYILGSSFEIITDHKALTFLESTMYQNARLIRWSLLTL